jgi:hypothetical protein
VLWCALVFGLVGMHHLPGGAGQAMAEAPGATVMAAAHAVAQAPCCTAPGPAAALLSPAHDSGGGHDMLHLCLAILLAAAALVLASILRRRSHLRFSAARACPAGAAAGRGPPRFRRCSDLLSSLCVLRV